jgi:hypothetical protein
MSTQERARTLMLRRQHAVKNRQHTMLSRAAEEIGLDLDTVESTQQSTKK